MEFSLLQSVGPTANGDQDKVISISAATAGSLICISTRSISALPITGVTDDKGNVYDYLVEEAGVTNIFIYGMQVVGGATSITISCSSAVTCRYCLGEFNGFESGLSNEDVFNTSSKFSGYSRIESSVPAITTGEKTLIVASLAYTTAPKTSSPYSLITADTGYSLLAYNVEATSNETAPVSFFQWDGTTPIEQAVAEIAISFQNPSSSGAYNFFQLI